MAAKSNLTNMAACLTLVCLVCAAILGLVYEMTVEPIKQAQRADLIKALSMVFPEGSDISTDSDTLEMEGVKYECFKAVSPAGDTSVAVKSTVTGFGGPLTVMVSVCDGKVFCTKVLSHSETPGLGAKCEDLKSHFVRQFDGFDPSVKKLSVTKDGGDIDAITASTITSRAYTLAVANAVRVAADFQKPAAQAPETKEAENE